MLKVLLEMLDQVEAAWKAGYLTRREAQRECVWIGACMDAHELEQQIAANPLMG